MKVTSNAFSCTDLAVFLVMPVELRRERSASRIELKVGWEIANHIVLALSMTAYRIVSRPEAKVWLALVVLYLEVVDFPISMVGAPDHGTTASNVSFSFLLSTEVHPYSWSMMKKLALAL